MKHLENLLNLKISNTCPNAVPTRFVTGPGSFLLNDLQTVDSGKKMYLSKIGGTFCNVCTNNGGMF